MKKTMRSLLACVLALLMSVSALVGTTFAWFTDSVTSANNIIKSGTLDVEMHWTDDLESDKWINVEDDDAEPVFDYDKWEPGYTEVRYIKIVNAGSLAFKYTLDIIPTGTVGAIAEVLGVYFAEDVKANISSLAELSPVGNLKTVLSGDVKANGVLLPKGEEKEGFYSGEIVVAVAIRMYETAGNEYQNLSVGDSFDIQIRATQYNYESDSFGDNYDEGALFPEIKLPEGTSVAVEKDADGKTVSDVKIQSSTSAVSALVPAGVKVAQGVDKLTFNVVEMDTTTSNVTLAEGEEMRSLDVHVEGVADDNKVAIIITLPKAMKVGLNIGNYKLYHVEDDTDVEMTYVAALSEVNEHNEFYYDPATGDITVAMKSFSEVAFVAEESKWEGNRDYTWYDANATTLVIANADQLAGFGAIVGGMDGQTQDSFSGKTVRLVADIKIGDTNEYYTDASENGIVFYPIGYYNSEGTYKKTGTAITSGFKKFEGTFDGNGHTISDFYQNTWEMKGDHNWYDATLQYYRDGMGLFGKVYGGTVKNLVIENFSSDGEITTTGTVAAYADCGATFENIAIFNCNPRVYNIGNGGIVGVVGWYANDAHTEPVTFKNITVDNTNKISALWGSWDVACGGIVGQYYPTSGQENAIDNAGIHMENCHAAAQIDVYNDVCANYQYYAYRYSGILIGSVRENVEQNGYVYPDMDGITASGCTVHFGDWNDYYYCEIVANSLASYTHDHQMSRLTQVQAINGTTVTYLDGTTGTVPTSGWAHYVVVKAKDANGKWIHGDGANYATCYHFNNGEVWNHADAGTETVGGVEVLKEDKQLIYREFNNLVTGYGWGVTSKGVGDLAGVTILDKYPESVNKFQSNGVTEIESSTAIKLSELFQYISTGFDLKLDQLQVSVSDLNHADGIATGTFTKGATWEESTITVNGKGAVAITIQDYYFCIPYTITLTVVDPMTIEVTSQDEYVTGDVFNPTVTVTYKHSGTKVLTASEYTVTGFDSSKAGYQTVIVTYSENGQTVSDSVVVMVSGTVSISVEALKDVYSLNSTPSKDDFRVIGRTSSGKQIVITNFELNTIDTSTVGVKEVTVTFTTEEGNVLKATTNINVIDSTILTVDRTSTTYNGGYHRMYMFQPNNFSVSGWANLNGGLDYASYVGQTYTAPMGETVTGFNNDWDLAASQNRGTWEGFAGYEWFIGENQYDLTIDNALPFTRLGINCNIGYDAPIAGFGYYINDDPSTLKFQLGNFVSSADTNFGPYAVTAFYEISLADFTPGETYTVHWVAVFGDGVQNISEWTVNMKPSSADDKMFTETEKPNVNVIVMAGQSNMYGVTPLTQGILDQYGVDAVDYSNVFIRYKNLQNAGTYMYTNSSNDAFEMYRPGIGGAESYYFGPELGLAASLAENKDEVWYIIKYSASGTALGSQWTNATMVDNTNTVSLTDDMIAYVQAAIDELTQDYDVKVCSFMWMQGESDATDSAMASNYAAMEKTLVSRVRTAFAQYATRTVSAPTTAGSGILYINSGIAADNGANGWTYSDSVNDAKVGNSEYLFSYKADPNTFRTEAGPLTAYEFKDNMGNFTYTIKNPNQDGVIANSIFVDTHYFTTKSQDTDNHAEYQLDSDKSDVWHYGVDSMYELGMLYAASLIYINQLNG